MKDTERERVNAEWQKEAALIEAKKEEQNP